MASLAQDLRDVFSQVGVQERKQLLANIFLFPTFDEEDDLRTSILLDMYYDALSFLVNLGFPWREVVKFFGVFRILWLETQGKPLAEAITLFQQHLSSIVEYSSDNNLKSVVDYAFSTLFQHYKLYQFVLTRDRAENITTVHSIVEPPRSLPAMSESVQKSTWDEEQKLKQIDELEQRKRQKREAYYDCEMQQALQQLEEPLSHLEIGTEQLTKEELTTVIGDVTAGEAAITDAKIRHKIDEIHDSIQYQFMRANVGHVYDALGKKSASSRVSKKRSGKK